MTTAEQGPYDAAMRRALELAANGPALGRQPAGRLRAAGCRGHDRRRGLAPRRRNPARRGGCAAQPRRTELSDRCDPRTHRRRHPRALQPHGPHRPVQRRPASRPASRASSTRSPTPATSSSGGAERLRDGGRRGDRRRARRRGRPRSCTPGSPRRRTRPPVRHRQVGVEPRRPRRSRRRLEPVDHRHRGAAARARAARGERRDPGRHRHRARRRPAPHRSRRCRRAARAAAHPGRDRRARSPADAAAAQPPGRAHRGSEPRSRAACCPGCTSAASARVYVEGGPTLASAVIAGGFADEYAVYLAPVLLGGDRVADRRPRRPVDRRGTAARASSRSSRSATTCS